MSHLRRLRRARVANRKIPEWTYQPLASQVRFHTRLNRFKGYSGPIGSGKSYALVYEALFLSEINAGLTGLLGAPTFPMLRDSHDPRFFAQEVLGEYLDVFGGAVYHAYSAANEREVEYDPHLRLIWTCDFNVDPTCSLICQMAHRVASQAENPLDAKREVRVLDEICLPDSNTEASCREFIRRTENWTKVGRALQVEVYGDAAGSARKSAGQSDYAIIRDVFKNDPRYHLQFHIQSANPLIRDRINAVNSMLCNALGEHRLFHHRRCQELKKDLRQVKWQRDLSGNSTGVEDKKDKRRTHVSSALGYLIESEFSLTRKEPRIRLL